MTFKKIHIKILAGLIAILCAGSLNSQTINISDANFAEYIFNNHPSSSPELGKLDTIAAKTITGIFNLNNRHIKNIDEIVYFKSLTEIHAYRDTIRSFPKLTGFNNLEVLNLTSCGLRLFPDISGIPNIKSLYLGYNNIETLPDFSSLPLLDSVIINENNINWPELVKLTSIAGFDTIFNVFKQKDLSPSTYNYVYKGESLQFEFPGNLENDVLNFRWHYGNEWANEIIGAENRVYIIDSIVDDKNSYEVSSNYRGIYQWGSGYLISGENWVYGYNCPEADSVTYNISFDCNTGYQISFSQLGISYDTLLPGYTYEYNILDTDNNIIQTVATGTNYGLNPGRYKVQFTNNNSCYSLYDTTIVIPDYPVCDCIESDALDFNIDFSCENGYTVNFTEISYKGLTSIWLTPYLVDSINNKIMIQTTYNHTVYPGDYKVLYTNNGGCDVYFDTTISINKYPEIETTDFETFESCDKTEIEFSDIILNSGFVSPLLSLESAIAEHNTSINLNERIELLHGDYYVHAYEGLYCKDSTFILNTTEIAECNCINQVDITYEHKSDCKSTELNIRELSAPDNYIYNVIAHNEITGIIDTISTSAPKLPHGMYTLKITDNKGCEKIAYGNIELKQSGTCDIVLYDNVEGGSSSHYLEGKGSVQLINEAGRIIYKTKLPANITTSDLQGNRLPSGLYILLFEDGSNTSITIVR